MQILKEPKKGEKQTTKINDCNIQINNKQIKKSFINWMRKNFVSEIFDFDWRSEFDSSLTDAENKTIIADKFSNLKIQSQSELKQIAQQHENQINAQIRKEESALIENWNNSKIDHLNSQIQIGNFQIPKSYIQMLIKRIGSVNAVILVSEGGYSKSYTTIKTIKEANLRYGSDYVYITGHITPMLLYEILYLNNDKLIVFDDTDLFEEEKILLLKSALWEVNGIRKVDYNSSSSYLAKKGIPHSFEFIGQIIILANEFDKNSKNLQALASRCLYYEIIFSLNDKKEILRNVAKEAYKSLNEAERLKLCEELIGLLKISTKNLNIRTLIKMFDFYLFDNINYKILLMPMIENDNEIELIAELMRSDLPVNEQIKLFIGQTGKSRATYFNYKKVIANEKMFAL